LTARDDDVARPPPDFLTFSILSGNTLNGSQYFDIVPSTGQLILTHDMDYVVSFLLHIRVVDSTNLTATAFVSVTVSNSNSRPMLNNIAATRFVAENYAGFVANLTWYDEDPFDGHTIEIVDASPLQGLTLFTLTKQADGRNDGYAFLTLTTPLNFECARVSPSSGCPTLFRSFSLSISITDSGIGNLTTFGVLQVNLTNVNEAPVVANTSYTVTALEMSPVASVLNQSYCFPDYYDDDKTPLTFTLLTTGTPFAVSAGNVSSYRTPSTVCQTTLDSFNTLLNKYPSNQFPILTVAQNVLNFEVTNSYQLSMRVSDGTSSTTVALTVLIGDVQEAPYFLQTTLMYTIVENTPGGVVVGGVSASDPDTFDVQFYSIRQVQQIRFNGAFDYEVQDANTRQLVRRFQISPTLGTITVRPPGFGSVSVLDFEE
jgi:hypothetical protein